MSISTIVTCPRCDQRMEPTQLGMMRCPCGLTCHESTAANEAVREGYRESRKRQALQTDPDFPSKEEREALAFAFEAAAGSSGGQTRMRRLLFAWFNAQELGGFDFTDLWSLDQRHLSAALTIIRMIARSPMGWYPEHYGYDADMTALVETYGPRQ